MDKHFDVQKTKFYRDLQQPKLLNELIPSSVKLVALYISMMQCPPCKEFTPLLNALYTDVNSE